jgi:hypothetical protein
MEMGTDSTGHQRIHRIQFQSLAIFIQAGCGCSTFRAIQGLHMSSDHDDFNARTEQKQILKLRYIHRNPVKRGLVEKPEQWNGSSFRSYLYVPTYTERLDRFA